MSGERILVVDDNEKVRDVLTHILESAGYKPLATGDPNEALLVARKETPDLALLDVMMPSIDGFDLCQMLRDHSETSGIPVVFVTALGDDISRARGQVSGGMIHVQKPFKKEDVLGAVHAALNARKSRPKRTGSGWARARSLDALREGRRGTPKPQSTNYEPGN